MASSLKGIRKRIGSVRNIQQITKAMKMVSAARLRRAQEAALAARPYAEKLEAVLRNLAARRETLTHPFLARREETRVDLLFVGSDRGLCGSYNANLLRTAQEFLKDAQSQGRTVAVTVVGRKGFEHFERRRVAVAERYLNLYARYGPELAQNIADKLGGRLASGERDAVYALYSRFRSTLSQVPRLERPLPIEARGGQGGA